MPVPTNCPQCNHEVKEKSGISKRTEKPYKFNGCTNYPACTWIYREFKEENSTDTNERAAPVIAQKDIKAEILKRIDAFRDDIARL